MKKSNPDHQQKFTAGLIQISLEQDVNHNLDKAVTWVSKAAKEGAQVICLPELFRSQYFCQKENIEYFDLAETIPGPTTKTLGKIAKENKVIVIAPVFEKRAPGIYHNSAVILNTDGEIIGLYRKMHIPDD